MNIVLQIARMNRDPEYFEDPLEFRPERFSDNSQSEMFYPMGKGPKSCIGQYFAMIEMRVILAEFVRAYGVLRQNTKAKCLEIETRWDIAQQPILEEHVAVLPRKHLILVGAHSVGKTTLAQYAAERFQCEVVKEAARDLLDEMKVTAADLLSNQQLNFEFQRRIVKTLSTKHGSSSPKLTFFDRCAIDALAYARFYLDDPKKYEELRDMDETQQLIAKYRDKKQTIVFLIEPREECLHDDHVRMLPKNFEEWRKFSDTYKTVMDELRIPFETISDLDLNKRFVQILERLSSSNNRTL